MCNYEIPVRVPFLFHYSLSQCKCKNVLCKQKKNKKNYFKILHGLELDLVSRATHCAQPRSTSPFNFTHFYRSHLKKNHSTCRSPKQKKRTVLVLSLNDSTYNVVIDNDGYDFNFTIFSFYFCFLMGRNV